MSENPWRDLENTYPDWSDTGPAEFMRADGSVVRGRLLADEVWTGEDEIPVFTVEADDGTHPDFFGFEKWRPAARS